MYYRLRAFDHTDHLLVASDHASARLAGEQAARLSRVSLEWAEPGEPRLSYQLRVRQGAGQADDLEREPDIDELDEMLAGMETVEAEVTQELRERYGI